jgi:uncharacterized protein YndB with AHSA1/START domain
VKTIHHVFEIAAPREDVYTALSTSGGLASWWTTLVEAETALHGMVDFTFGGDFNPNMRITELTPGETVRWRCVAGHEPWADNDFSFELEATAAGTRVRFWQHYAQELSDDAYGVYNFNWGYYLESLRRVCESGVGKPFQAGVQKIGAAS